MVETETQKNLQKNLLRMEKLLSFCISLNDKLAEIIAPIFFRGVGVHPYTHADVIQHRDKDNSV